MQTPAPGHFQSSCLPLAPQVVAPWVMTPQVLASKLLAVLGQSDVRIQVVLHDLGARL